MLVHVPSSPSPQSRATDFPSFLPHNRALAFPYLPSVRVRVRAWVRDRVRVRAWVRVRVRATDFPSFLPHNRALAFPYLPSVRVRVWH